MWLFSIKLGGGFKYLLYVHPEKFGEDRHFRGWTYQLPLDTKTHGENEGFTPPKYGRKKAISLKHAGHVGSQW